MVIQEHNEQLQRSLHQFMRTIRTLSTEQFLQPMNGWSPRDVVAHMIGWNWAAIGIADAIRLGQAPEILIDPGEDFSKVNAAFVRQYDSTDMTQLMRELELSYQALARHLYTLQIEDWTRQVAVPGRNNPVSIEGNTKANIRDYDDHRLQIEEWLLSFRP